MSTLSTLCPAQVAQRPTGLDVTVIFITLAITVTVVYEIQRGLLSGVETLEMCLDYSMKGKLR